MWLTSAGQRAVIRVDPRAAGGGMKTVRLASPPGRLAVGEGAVWVTLPAVDGITRSTRRTTPTSSPEAASLTPDG